MSNARDDIFSFIGRFFLNSAVGPDRNGEKGDSRQMLALFAILAFVGNEAVKVIFRKNFGMSILAWVRVSICFLCFAALSAVSFAAVSYPEDFENTGTVEGHIFSGWVFALLALVVLTKCIKDYNKKADPDYSGDSNVLGFLRADGWRKQIIQNLFEPLMVLVIGLTLLLFDYIGGTAFIFCAISVWLNALFDLLFTVRSMEEDLDDMNSSHTRKGKFNKAR